MHFCFLNIRAHSRGRDFEIKSVLSPLSSAINYAPYSEETLKDEVANRMGMTAALRRTLSLPGLWPVIRKLLSWVDHRPGRLYSFVCTRP